MLNCIALCYCTIAVIFFVKLLLCVIWVNAFLLGDRYICVDKLLSYICHISNSVIDGRCTVPHFVDIQ